VGVGGGGGGGGGGVFLIGSRANGAYFINTLNFTLKFVCKIIHAGTILFILLYSMPGVGSPAVPAFVSVN